MPPETDYTPRVERRYTAGGLRIERRASADGAPETRQIVGHAAVFDQQTTLYEGRYWTWRETIRPGAFRNAIKQKQDVRSLFNHDPNFVLGRTKAGTLQLEEDKIGLLSRTDPPDTPTIRDLVLAPIERGDISGMSFGFTPRKASKVTRTETADGEKIDAGGLVISLRFEGDTLIEEWEVRDADLFDVSPVTFPAYEGTDVGLRSHALGMDFYALVAEKDRPHTRQKAPVVAPLRDQFKAWLARKA